MKRLAHVETRELSDDGSAFFVPSHAPRTRRDDRAVFGLHLTVVHQTTGIHIKPGGHGVGVLQATGHTRLHIFGDLRGLPLATDTSVEAPIDKILH